MPITKIDAAQRLVYGVVTAEKPDVSGEVCDYASTKPLYQKWSQNFASATDGKSLGNLRAMHGHVAAGKLVEIAFNDEAKQVEICGKVVDDAEWQKVEEGVYTGFSQGGRYLKRWPDPDRPSLTRYTAEPLEVSLVDHPCLPEATFAVIKADGSTELRKFKAGTPADAMADAQRSPKSAPAIPRPTRSASGRSMIFWPTSIPIAAPAHRHSRRQCRAGPAIFAAGRRAWRRAPTTTTLRNSPRCLERRVERPLAKALHGVTTRLDEMASRVKKIEDQPLPLGASSVRVAEKSEDSQFAAPDHLLDRRARSRRSPSSPSARRSPIRCAPCRAFARARSSTASLPSRHSGARAQLANPESITTVRAYGFRIRRCASLRNDG